MRVSEGPGTPWGVPREAQEPEGQFRSDLGGQLGASWPQNVQKLMVILMISMKMCVSPTREHHFEAWGSPRRLRRRPPSLKVRLWRPQERTLGAPRRLQDAFGADFTPSRIHCYGQCFQHMEKPRGRPESLQGEQGGSNRGLGAPWELQKWVLK